MTIEYIGRPESIGILQLEERLAHRSSHPFVNEACGPLHFTGELFEVEGIHHCLYYASLSPQWESYFHCLSEENRSERREFFATALYERNMQEFTVLTRNSGEHETNWYHMGIYRISRGSYSRNLFHQEYLPTFQEQYLWSYSGDAIDQEAEKQGQQFRNLFRNPHDSAIVDLDLLFAEWQQLAILPKPLANFQQTTFSIAFAGYRSDFRSSVTR